MNDEQTSRGEPTRVVMLRFTGEGLDMLGWGIVLILSYLAMGIPLALVASQLQPLGGAHGAWGRRLDLCV